MKFIQINSFEEDQDFPKQSTLYLLRTGHFIYGRWRRDAFGDYCLYQDSMDAEIYGQSWFELRHVVGYLKEGAE